MIWPLSQVPMHHDTTVIGLDLAKQVFQVHAISAEGTGKIRCDVEPAPLKWSTPEA